MTRGTLALSLTVPVTMPATVWDRLQTDLKLWVTGVALISFILLAVGGAALGITDEISSVLKVELLVWIFVMRI
ncbi:MAG TPA: hypothetical protein PKJ24_07615, partial [Prolixibacteraceae bacterium]|nr:hypothetical protein [Prolixibacteraceae bacterium]